MFITNGKEYAHVDSIVSIEKAYLDPNRTQCIAFNVVTEAVDGQRGYLQFKDINVEDAAYKLEEVFGLILEYSKYRWVIMEGSRSIYRVNGLKYITASENTITFATNDGVFKAYGRTQQELEMYKIDLMSNEKVSPSYKVDFTKYFLKG